MAETVEQYIIRNDANESNQKQISSTFDPLFHKSPKYDIYGKLVS